jgi:hypothetical protein
LDTVQLVVLFLSLLKGVLWETTLDAPDDPKTHLSEFFQFSPKKLMFLAIRTHFVLILPFLFKFEKTSVIFAKFSN